MYCVETLSSYYEPEEKYKWGDFYKNLETHVTDPARNQASVLHLLDLFKTHCFLLHRSDL